MMQLPFFRFSSDEIMLSAKERYLSKCLSRYLDEQGFDHKRVHERITFNRKYSSSIDITAKYEK
jgi:hypothetical protein